MVEALIEHQGALFKRKHDGEYHQAVFCPTCEGLTSSLADMLCFYCSRCNWRSEFTGKQLPAVMKDLPDADADG